MNTTKNARKMLEVPLESAMSCKIDNRHGETRCTPNDSRKTRYACIIEAHESTRSRMRPTQTRDHENDLADKGFNSLSHLQSCAQARTIRQAMENLVLSTRGFVLPALAGPQRRLGHGLLAR